MDGIKWIFFDMGSTLIDESKVYEMINRKMASGAGVSYEYVCEKSLEFYKQNKKGDLEVSKMLGVERAKWDPELEILYDCTVDVLETLKSKYKLGIIANQMYGSEKRLENFGIRKYFDVIVASAEEGVEKPDRRMFEIALERAGIEASEAVMVGDRIDNDIVPANKMGMKTIWVKQGNGRFWKIGSDEEKADLEAETLSDIVDML